MVSKEFERVYPMRKDSTAPPIVLCRSTDWKGLKLPSAEKRCEAGVKKFECSPTALAEWIELQETLAKFQAESGKKTSRSGDKGSDF